MTSQPNRKRAHLPLGGRLVTWLAKDGEDHFLEGSR